MSHHQAFETFLHPPTEFGLIPFWFWNDDLDEEELIRQLRGFHEAGFGGVVPHARTGLSHRVGYLTDEYFRLVRAVVEEAARLGMKVILYDEGSYPSGSANGAVVAENPDYATRALFKVDKTFEGPCEEFWRPPTVRAIKWRHVCTVLGRVLDDGSIDPESAQVLEPLKHTIFRIDVPAGSWKAISLWDIASGGTIRGVFVESEDFHATAPPSSDILNPEAVACFIRLTHDRYYEELSEFFGDTIIAMFTDEPCVMGREPARVAWDSKPYTPGFEDWIAERWGEDPRPWLPALWEDYGEGTEAFRYRYGEAVQTRLHEVFYGAQSAWCTKHGIDLAGHPAESNELTALRLFQMPGQDMVWRFVEPNNPTGIEGPHSPAAKTATSGGRLGNRRRILTEVCGAYGWRLSLDEVKWLFDWHLVRGNNLISPHAVFYSIRERRAWESEPDLAIHNVWWPYFKDLAVYARRLCWMLTDGDHACEVAILGDGNNLSWKAAKQLFQSQIDFLYLDDQAVVESGLNDGKLTVGSQAYSVVIVEEVPDLSDEARARLDAFAAAGGTVIYYDEDVGLVAAVDASVDRDLRLTPGNPDLRFIHYRKEGMDCYLLVNEGETTIEGTVQLSIAGAVEIWDAMNGTRRPAGDGDLSLSLGRRESIVLVVDAQKEKLSIPDDGALITGRIAVEAGWTVERDGEKKTDFTAGQDWSKASGWELFTGRVDYKTEISFPKADTFGLDLGDVGDIAEVLVDGKSVGSRLWAPHVVPLGPVEAGMHEVEVRVTNSMANEFEGMQLPSGLMGPVTLIARTRT